MSWLNELDVKRDELRALCPGWLVWYVVHHDRRVVWCARPEPLLNEDTPEHLVEAVCEADAARLAELTP